MISSSQLSVGTTYGLYSADSVGLDRHLAVGLGFEGSNVRHSRGSGTCPTTITCYVMSTMSRLLRETWLLLDPLQNRTRGKDLRASGLRLRLHGLFCVGRGCTAGVTEDVIPPLSSQLVQMQTVIGMRTAEESKAAPTQTRMAPPRLRY